jgi:hypothetical protein
MVFDEDAIEDKVPELAAEGVVELWALEGVVEL